MYYNRAPGATVPIDPVTVRHLSKRHASPLSRFYYRPLTATHVTPSRDRNLELLTGVNVGTPARVGRTLVVDFIGRRSFVIAPVATATVARSRDTACNFSSHVVAAEDA